MQGNSSFARVRIIPHILCPILPVSTCIVSRNQTVWFCRATIYFDEFNQLLSVPHICIRSLELIAGNLVIVAVQHSTNYNHDSCIWQLWDVTIHFCTSALSQIRRRLLVTSPSLLPRLPNHASTFLQKHQNLLSLNPFSIIDNFKTQPVLESLQKICNVRLPVQGSLWQLFETVLSWDTGLMLLFWKHSHPYYLPLVERNKVGLAHPFAKLLQG